MKDTSVVNTTVLIGYFVLETTLYPYYIIEGAYYRAENRTYPKGKKRW